MEGQMKGRPHALVLPCAGQGHINPLMQLAQHLEACHGFLITFVNTHDNHASILQSLKLTNNLLHQDATSCRSLSYPDIKLVGLSPAPPSSHGHPFLADFLLLPLIPSTQRLICDVNLSPTPFTCIIADAFLYWVPQIARSAHIPSLFAFFPSSAANLSLLFHARSLLSTGLLNPDGSLSGCVESLIRIPGLPHIQSKNVSWIAGCTSEDTHALFNLAISTGDHLKDFDAILLNTYQELENEALDGLVKLNLHVISIGPLIFLETHTSTYNIACTTLWTKDEDCLEWLDGRPKSSVIYIAFGSLANFNVTDLHELALGIEASQQSFLWVLGPLWMHKENECLPEGFRERTRDRAIFIPWAPQSLVLSHPSIGVFLTHCGWNSTMEGISAGVPMLTWPFLGDQALNCQYIVEEWKIGMSITHLNCVIHHHEVKNIVLSIMVGMEGAEMRERVAKVKEKAKFALEKESGKSFKNLRDVIHGLTISM